MKLTQEEKEFLIKYYKDKIERHSKILKGYKLALKDMQENDYQPIENREDNDEKS